MILLIHYALRRQDMIQQETVGMVCKAINNQEPEYLLVLLNRVSAMTVRTIRNATLGQNFFAQRGALLWNNLPTEIKSAKSYFSFKNKLKKTARLSADLDLVQYLTVFTFSFYLLLIFLYFYCKNTFTVNFSMASCKSGSGLRGFHV